MNKIDKLSTLRKKVQNYDMKILDLFEKRFKTCLKIAKEKQNADLDIFQPSVEEKLKNLWLNKQDKILTAVFLNKLFTVITKHSRDLQSTKISNVAKILK